MDQQETTEKQKLKFSRNALFHMKTKVCLIYFSHNCSADVPNMLRFLLYLMNLLIPINIIYIYIYIYIKYIVIIDFHAKEIVGTFDKEYRKRQIKQQKLDF